MVEAVMTTYGCASSIADDERAASRRHRVTAAVGADVYFAGVREVLEGYRTTS